MKLYKYTPHNKCHKYDIVKKCELWFSETASFNDPIDSNLEYRQQYSKDEIVAFWKNFLKNRPNHPQSLAEILQKYGENKAFVKFKSENAKCYKSMRGVLSMSQNPKNILMWSHYANHHKGIVYEFETRNLFSHAKTLDFKDFPYKVSYAFQYELLSYIAIGDEAVEQYRRELLTKAQDWAYEKEYRYIDLQKSGAKKFNPSCLTSIIFGKRTEQDEINAVMECCEKHNLTHIKFKQADFIDDKFELEFKDI